ncbi:MAG: hypothetical protein LBD16_01120 [Oscillospiraceae bacterium]|jgi:hypothetical protein|nr:hypothetical protein [Oscillospiraceae bacterium]
MKKNLSFICAVSLLLVLTACSSLDVVGRDSVRAFTDLLNAYPAQTPYAYTYSIASPDGGAEFVWSVSGIQMKAKVAPFVEAGLNPSEFDNADEEWLYFANEFIMLGQSKKDAASQFEYLASIADGRSAIGFHAQMNHYNISLGGGNMFEWAKDLASNDKDIVFVLEPEPFVSAGVDVENVEGWTYAEVTVDQDGQMVNVWKLLKAVDVVK